MNGDRNRKCPDREINDPNDGELIERKCKLCGDMEWFYPDDNFICYVCKEKIANGELTCGDCERFCGNCERFGFYPREVGDCKETGTFHCFDDLCDLDYFKEVGEV